MDTIYIQARDLEGLKKALHVLDENCRVKSFMLLMADSKHFNKEELEPILRSSNKSIIGGVFPEIIYNGERKKEGLILIPAEATLKTAIFNLDDSNEKITDILINEFGDMSEVSGTLIVYTDALGSNKNIFLDSIFNFFGTNVNYLGGGTGSLRFHSFPNIIDANSMYGNAGVIGLYPHAIDIGVGHGWKKISEPIKVTKIEGRKIVSLNWEPAFEVYKKAVETHAGKNYNREDFEELIKSYPVGIAVIDSEMLIRDLYAIEQDNLLFLDRIVEGEYINIMHGNIELLLDGAKQAREKTFTIKNDRKNLFCIDCISRVLYMEDDFSKELDILQQDGKVSGALGLGEIANTGESFLECYNKTVVLAKW